MKKLLITLFTVFIFSVIPFTANAATDSSREEILGPSIVNVSAGSSVEIPYTVNGGCADWDIDFGLQTQQYLYAHSDGLMMTGPGLLMGQPMGPGTFKFQIFCYASSGWIDKDITLNAYDNQDIITPSIPNGQFNVKYKSVIFRVWKPVKGIKWIVKNHLPPGLHLSTAGTLYGTPTKTGTYNLDIDALYPTKYGIVNGDRIYTIKIGFNQKDIITTSIPSGSLNKKFTPFRFKVDKPVKGLIWKNETSLPPGLHLSSAGTLYGTPTKIENNYPVKIEVGYPYKGKYEFVDQSYKMTIINS